MIEVGVDPDGFIRIKAFGAFVGPAFNEADGQRARIIRDWLEESGAIKFDIESYKGTADGVWLPYVGEDYRRLV